MKHEFKLFQNWCSQQNTYVGGSSVIANKGGFIGRGNQVVNILHLCVQKAVGSNTIMAHKDKKKSLPLSGSVFVGSCIT